MEGNINKPITLNDFSGGYVSAISPYISNTKFFTRGQNVCNIDKLSVQKRLGRTQRDSTGYGTGNGAIYHNFISYNSELVSGFATKLYSQVSATGSFTERLTGATSDFWEFEPFGSYLLAINNTDKALQAWDGNAATFSAVGAAPSGTMIRQFYSYVFMAGIAATPNTLRYSDAGDHTTWDAANTWPVSSNDGDQITGLYLLGERMYVFKANSIHRFTYLGGVPLFEVKKVSDIGTESRRTIKRIFFKDRYYLVFLSNDKNIYMFDGYNPPISISENVRRENQWGDLSFNDVDEDYFSSAFAVYFKEYKWYVLFFRASTGSAVGYGFIGDFSSDAVSWWPLDSQALTEATEFGSSVIAFDSTGKTLDWFSGNSDDGTAINAYYESPFLIGNTGFLLEGQHIGLVFKATNKGVQLGYKIDYNDSAIIPDTSLTLSAGGDTLGDTFTLGTSELGGDVFSYRKLDLPYTFNNLRVRISDNSTNAAFKCYLIDVYLRKKGIGDSYGTY